VIRFVDSGDCQFAVLRVYLPHSGAEMAKKKRTRKATEEELMVQRLSDMLKEANFSVQHQLELGSKGRPDLIAEREDLGMYRRYAIDVAIVNDPARLVSALNALQSYAETRKDTEYDEYWLVSNLSYSQDNRRRRPRFQNVRAFAFKELERMLFRANPKKRPPPKTDTTRTATGKAIKASEKEIMLVIAGLILQIDDKLEKLGSERPNSDDAKAKVAEEISDFQRMKAELERIRALVAAFKKDKVPEKDVVKATKTFRQGIEHWWTEKSGEILTSTAKGAVLVSSIGLLALMKADSVAAITAVATVINGGAIQKAKQIGRAVKRVARRLAADDDSAVQ
jgi:hypothetical protein